MSVILRGKNPRKPHTVRYWADGRQREKSFATAREARDFRIKVDHDTRAQIFVDDRAGREPFGPAAEAFLNQLAISPRSRATYAQVWATHLEPALAHRSNTAVAQDRDAVSRLLTSGPLGLLSISKRRAARRIILGVLDEAVKAGKIARHRCGDIELADHSPRNQHSDFVFPAHAQVAQVAEAAGIAVWLMRGCGLRIEEALAVERTDFRDGTSVLRVSGQSSRDGRTRVPLKYRKPGEYRDVPVPGWLQVMVRDLPDGPMCPGRDGRLYRPYRTALNAFSRTAARAGIPAGFTPHSLRHAFASALLARLVPITDVAVWLGHRDINTTYATYGHLVPSAAARAVTALDAEYAEWTSPNR